MRALALLIFIFLLGCAHRPVEVTRTRPFDFSRDTFAFANETVWTYHEGKKVAGSEAKNYTRRCFVMSRAALQFWKFARFEPGQPRLTSAELKRRIRQVTARDVWKKALSETEKIVFPGYPHLRAMSQQEGQALRENIGLGWPTYFRPGNWVMPFVPSREQQAETFHQLVESIRRGMPQVLWLYNFPQINMNHAVVVYAYQMRGKEHRFTVYDPNDAQRPRILSYDAAQRTFSFEKMFYFVGGPVQARVVYQGVWQ